jgi:guanylate kinase
MSGMVFVVSAPSGTGKTSLVSAVLSSDPQLVVSVSHTTRPPREGEINGQNYHFVSEQDFQTLIEQNKFIEYAKVFNNWYGTSIASVESLLAAGKDVILEIDWQGFDIVRKQFKTVSLFILPPSKQALVERLVHRAKDKPEVIEARIKAADSEVRHNDLYDYLLVNDDFEQTVQDIQAIFRAARLQTVQQAPKLRHLLAQFT